MLGGIVLLDSAAIIGVSYHKPTHETRVARTIMAQPEPTITETPPPQDEADLQDFRPWWRDQLLTTAASLAVHLALLLLLLFFTHSLERPAGLPLFLKIGDAKSASGTIENADPSIFEPLNMPAVDVTRLEPRERPPTLTPDLPRIAIGLPSHKPAAGKSAESVDLKGFGDSQFEGLTERVQGVSVKIGDPQFTLIWDTDADLDLHVIEPGGSHIYWEYRNGKRGGELDVDDVDGQGPENIFWKKGAGPRGDYKWWVHYYGGFGGKLRRTKWQVRIKHDGVIDLIEGVLTKIDEKSPERTFHK